MEAVLREAGSAPVYEIESASGKNRIAGRRNIRVVLHEIYPDSSTWNENGISWSEQFTAANMESVKGMSITAEFLNEERDTVYGHGLTGQRGNLPVFEDATVVGHFETASIEDVDLNGERRRVLVGEGTLDEMRYPKFVEWLSERMSSGTVNGSVEIVGKTANGNRIEYDGGWKEQGRVPESYDYSGYAILSVKPADNSAVVMELNSARKTQEGGEQNMNDELKAQVSELFSGMTEKWTEFAAGLEEKVNEINSLKSELETRDARIAELNAVAEQAKADLETKEQQLSEANARVAELEKEKAAAELNQALAGYSEQERAVAKEDIEKFNADPSSVEINAIVGKICAEIVRNAREKVQNSEISSVEIFGMVDTLPETDPAEEINIF